MSLGGVDYVQPYKLGFLREKNLQLWREGEKRRSDGNNEQEGLSLAIPSGEGGGYLCI